MASLLPSLASYSTYRDRRYPGSAEAYRKDMSTSATLYCGNLSFFTTEEQIYEVFSQCGEIKRIIMGLDRLRRKPCGFCFVEFYLRQDALDCLKFINGTKVDDRIIRTDLDPGFLDGRQFGRGKSGGQVRDEYRTDFDAGRGGYGARSRGGAYTDTEAPHGGHQYSGGGGGDVHSRLDFASKRRTRDPYDDDLDPTDAANDSQVQGRRISPAFRRSRLVGVSRP